MTTYRHRFLLRSFKEPYGVKAVILCNTKQVDVQNLIYKAIKNYDSGTDVPDSIRNKMSYVLWFIKSNIDCEIFSYAEFENLFI